MAKLTESNIGIQSNVYVIKGDVKGANKFSDPAFKAQIIDPAALKLMKRRFTLSATQEKLLEKATPCAYAKGKCTYGMVYEDGKRVFVNICDNSSCRLYFRCSSEPIYRSRISPDYITPPTPVDAQTTIELTGETVGTKTKKVKLHARGIRGRKKTVFDFIFYGTAHNSWAVRGFDRRLPDGTITYVRPHYRSRQSPGHVVGEEIILPRKYKIPQEMSVKFVTRYNDFIQKIKARDKARDEYIEFVRSQSQNEEYYRLKNVKSVETPDEIITSPIDSRILVNSGPGTGKTYSVIERLKYIVKNGLATADEVLVLCFSRNAVKVIRDRLSEAMNNGEIPYSAERLQICTFDSFATWYLMQTNPDCNLSLYSYDKRIEYFNREYIRRPAVLNDALRYLIIDEMQDIVGVRAELVQTLLKGIPCGFLLLGDLCQAIYDYSIESSRDLNASRLYAWIESYFGNGIKEFEITINKRTDGVADTLFKRLREAMLYSNFETQKRVLSDVVNTFKGMSEMSCPDDTKYSEAYLSWANYDAFRKSSDLYENSVMHELRTSNRRLMFRRELADIFCCYEDPRMTKQRFMNIGCQKGIEQNTLDEIWQAILYATEAPDDSEIISVAGMRKAFSMEKRVKECLLLRDEALKTVSTIHKAKGSEYDYVKVNLSRFIDTPDDIKVYYVALTRAKKGVEIKERSGYSRIKKTNTSRFFKTYYGKLDQIEIGMDGDIDPIGFVSKELGDTDNDVDERQRYISENIHAGDRIEIKRVDEQYHIVHNGHVIGCLSHEIFDNLTYFNYYGYPHRISVDNISSYENLYVKDVVSIVNKKSDAKIPEKYKDPYIWYGIEFCGMANALEQ